MFWIGVQSSSEFKITPEAYPVLWIGFQSSSEFKARLGPSLIDDRILNFQSSSEFKHIKQLGFGGNEISFNPLLSLRKVKKNYLVNLYKLSILF